MRSDDVKEGASGRGGRERPSKGRSEGERNGAREMSSEGASEDGSREGDEQ